MMATYFHGGSEIQATNPSDHLQTLYLMNPNFLSSYSDSSHNTNNNNNNNNNNNQSPTNMLLLNPSVGPNALMPHPPPPQQQPCQQLIGIPLPGPHSENHSRPSSSISLHPNREIVPAGNNNNSSLMHSLAVSRVHYNLWSPTVKPGPAHPGQIHPADVDGQMGFRRTGGAQGLSLSLSPNQQNPVAAVAVEGTAALGGGGDDGRMSVTVAAGGSTVSNGVQGVILGSKYLKAAQELLDQVVHVGDFNKGGGGPHKEKAKSVAATDDGGSSGGGGEGSSTGSKRPFDQLTTAQRQELQMKKAKLLSMLDEVEQRYRQYHTQMQVVVSSFEQAAGFGSAKSYTSLALQTISRQFRCLKDAITSQIKATSKSLGEEDKNGSGSGEGGVGSRLRFVDHQLRQQRALQQLGMMQHNAWRPQRGLPERAVSVLRAWLFEHFLHPYPKDSDKHMLAKQTGLTRSQVSNWFINARVRLWKPMVEEMYAEEVKSQEQLNNGGNNIEDNTNTNTNTSSTNNLDTTTNPSLNDHNKDQLSPTKTTVTPHQPDGGAAIIHHSDHHTTTNDMISAMSTTSSQGFSLIGSSSDMESLMGRSPKKQRSGSDIQQNSPSSILSMDMDMKPSDNHHHHHHHHHHHQDHGSGFNPYLVHEMGRFNPDPLTTHHHHYPNNGVSLTLGLPHCENNLSLGNHQQNFMSQGMNLGRRIDIGANEAEFCGISMGQPSHPNNNGYDSIDIQSRTRFAAQLLHDFVA